MKQQIKIAFRMTIVTTVIFGIGYPLLVTFMAQGFFPARANGEQIQRNGVVIGSRLIGQSFSSAKYFHSRPSAAGNGYDDTASGGSNLGPSNKQLMERVAGDVQKLRAENESVAVPIDLVTSSASGLDPDISPAAAEFQIPRVARSRGMAEAQLRDLVLKHTESRQFSILGEPRVNVLELNLDLDAVRPTR